MSLLQDPSLGLQGPLGIGVVLSKGRDTVSGFMVSTLSLACLLLLLVFAFSLSVESRPVLVMDEKGSREGAGKEPEKLED